MTRRHLIELVLSGCLLLSMVAGASAEVVRFHYTPRDLCGSTSLKVSGNGAQGEWRAWSFGVVTRPYYCKMRPTHLVTFRHPCSGRNVSVPIAFPGGTPAIYHRTNAIVYSFSTYTIRAEFLPDGSVDVIYNSGIFRPLP